MEESGSNSETSKVRGVEMTAKWYWICGISAYVAPAIIMLVYILANSLDRPVIGSLLWPLRLIKMLLGEG